MINPESFSMIGYVSVALWLGMIGLMILQEIKKPRRWFCHIALVLGLAALLFAKINSTTHVNRIEIDRSEQIAEQQARQEAARKAAVEARGDEVAQVRFAEDGSDDFLDKAGMDDADKAYFSEQAGGEDEPDEPAWKKNKKQRSATAQEDDSLEGMLDATEEEGGMDTDEVPVDKQQAEPSAIMPDADVARAHMVDGWNLKIIRWLLLLNVGLIALDYARRANSYDEAYYPLPLPGAWLAGLKPLDTAWPVGESRSVEEDLAWIIRRGDMFLYVTDESAIADDLKEGLSRYPFGIGQVDVIHVHPENELLTDELILESLWYSRASFVMDSPERASHFMHYAVKRLNMRRDTRATVAQPVHIIWAMDGGIPPELRDDMDVLAALTGVVFIEKAG